MSTPVSAPASLPAGSLREMLEQYVAMRRRLGYKFRHQGRMLTAFVEYLDQRGETTITVASALAWVTEPEGASICYQRQRLSAVRGFARHLAAFDPACQIGHGRDGDNGISQSATGASRRSALCRSSPEVS